jgi:hypothetical protein
MAQSTAMDFFSVRFCPYLANRLVFGVTIIVSAGKRRRSCHRLQDALLCESPRVLHPFGLFTPVDIVDSLLKGVPHFLALGPAYFASGLLYFAGLMTAAITRNQRYHEFYAIFFLLQTIAISFLIFQTLV